MNHNTAPSISQITTPVNNRRRGSSPIITQELERLNSNGKTRSRIIRGAVADGFPSKDTAVHHTLFPQKQRGCSPQRAATGGLFKQHDDIGVAEVVKIQGAHGSVRKVDTPTPRRRSLPPLASGVPSRSIFSKTKGHYEYADKSPMLPVARISDAHSKEVNMSDTSKDGRVQEVEAVQTTGAPLTKKQKAARHCKKWWWVHLLVFLAIVVLVVCLIIFVAIPRIAQSRVNGAKLSIQGIRLSQTQATNFTIAINSTIEADDSIPATIDAFEGVMYLEDWPPQTPFARIAFPSVTSAAMTAVNISQFTQILDLNAFTIFNDWFIVNETLRLTVKGDSHLQVRGLSRKYPVSFKKTLEIPALSNLNGTTVSNSSILLTPNADGNNFIGTANIPNRSFIQFELGNTTFINYMQNANGTFANVGQIFIDDLTISPGNNSYPLRGTVEQTPVLQQIQERPYCETGNIPFLLQGQTVINNDQLLTYFTDSLASTNQSVSIPILGDLQDLGLTISCSST